MSTLELLAYAAPLVAIAAFLFTPPGRVVVALITGTRVGRWLAVAAAVAYAAFVAWSATYRAGRRAGSAGALREVETANAEAKADRVRTEAKVDRESDERLRAELRRYSPVILAVVALGLGGCVTTPTGGPGRGGAFCDVERPPVLSEGTIRSMSHDELAAAVARLRHGEKHCGWKPKEKQS